MPRERVTTVYAFSELDAAAQERAVEQIRAVLAGPWWDSADDEAVGEAIVYALAQEIDVPGVDNYGEGDFPGIRGVSVDGWDLRQAGSLDVSGTLTPRTAPRLPWPDDCDRFRLGADERKWTGDNQGLWIADSYPEHPADNGRADVREFYAAWSSAVTVAVEAGRAALEYRTGDEYARGWLEANASVEFDGDGNRL